MCFESKSIQGVSSPSVSKHLHCFIFLVMFLLCLHLPGGAERKLMPFFLLQKSRVCHRAPEYQLKRQRSLTLLLCQPDTSESGSVDAYLGLWSIALSALAFRVPCYFFSTDWSTFFVLSSCSEANISSLY